MGEISGGEWLLIGCAIVLAAGLLDAATKWARKQYTPGDRSPDSRPCLRGAAHRYTGEGQS
jgi:hypothetical protein